jgi:TolA-binding protein
MGIGLALAALFLIMVFYVGRFALQLALIGPKEMAAQNLMDCAKSRIDVGDEAGMRGYLRMVVKEYPDTEAARDAKKILEMK